MNGITDTAPIGSQIVVGHRTSKHLYLAAVGFIKRVKKGHFAEHSPMLNDISQLESWGRVLPGLVRMYEGEVLSKLQVVQHLPFGSLLKWE